MKKILKHYGISFKKTNRELKGIVFLSPEEALARKDEFRKQIENYSYKEKLSETHLSYLQKIVEEEDSRLSTIESKIGQIIGQTGVLLALISLSAPLFYDQLDHFSLVVKVMILLLYVLGFLFFIVSIFQATKSLNIKNFIYVKPSVSTVLNPDYKTEGEFITIHIKDLIKGISNNIETNNLKGNILLYAHRAFRTGIMFIGTLGVLIIILFTFNEKPQIPIVIDSPFLIKNLNGRTDKIETSINRLRQELTDYHRKNLLFQDSLRFHEFSNELDSLEMELRDIRKELKREQKNTSANK